MSENDGILDNGGDNENEGLEGGISEARATNLLQSGYARAEETIRDGDKIEELLRRAEESLKSVRVAGFQQIAEAVSYVPVFISLVRAYIKGTYRDVPVGSIIAVVSALIYFVSPIDLVPDVIPVLGKLDDAGVILVCLKLVQNDLDAYIAWRDAH